MTGPRNRFVGRLIERAGAQLAVDPRVVEQLRREHERVARERWDAGRTREHFAWIYDLARRWLP